MTTGVNSATAKRTIRCPHCQTRLNVNATAKRYRCAKCREESPMPPVAAAPGPRRPQRDAGKKAAINTGICVLAGIGLIMSMQSTSLMNGTGTIWMGVVLAGVALAAALFLGAHVAARVVCAIAVVIALVSALAMEHQMSEKRDQITRDLHSIGTRR